MRKKTIKKTALTLGMILALGQLPMTAYAAETTVDISGKGAGAISNEIINAFASYDTVNVVGSGIADEIITINMPNNKKVIWKAQCVPRDGFIYPVLLKIKAEPGSNDTAKFVIADGAKLSHNKEHLSLIEDEDVDMDMTGGEIIVGNISGRNSGNMTEDTKRGLSLSGHNVEFNMTGGSITSYSNVSAISLSDGVDAYIDSTVKGLQRFTLDSSLDTVINYVGAANNNVTFGSKGAVVAFGLNYQHGLYHNSSYIVGSRRGIILDGRDPHTDAYWVKEGNKKAIKYTIGDTVEGEWDLTELPELVIYSFTGDETVLPTTREYNGEGYGVESLASIPEFDGTVKVMYQGIAPTVYPDSEQKPVLPGKYTAYLNINDGHKYGEDTVYRSELTDFTITKRAAKIKANSKTITKGEAIPALDYTVEGVLAGDTAFTGMPVLTTDASGDAAGIYNINVDISGLTADEKYTVTAENAVFTVNEAPQSGGSQATPSNPSVPNGNNNQGSPNVPNGNNNQGSPNTNSGKRPPSAINPINPNGGSNQGNTGNNNGGSRGRRSGGGGGTSSGGRSTRSASKSASGSSAGNWLMDSKGWWFKNADGSYPKSAWKQLSYNNSSDWYYFDSEGYMATGWREIAGRWYYLYEESANGHIKGAMAKDTVIGGYKVGSDGAWIK